MVRRLIVAVAVIALGIRIWGYYSAVSPYHHGQRVRITAVVRTNPIRVYQKLYLVFEGIAVEVPHDYQPEYGDRIAVTGTLTDEVIEIKSAKFGLMGGDFQLVSSVGDFLTTLSRLRQELIFRQQRWLPADEASLAAGIIFGGSEGMSGNLKRAFRRTGMTHIIAASGYNVSVVAGWTMLLFIRWLHRRLAISLGMVGIVMYVFLAGATAAVVRAAIMATAAWLGQLFGRESDSFWLLGLAAGVMLLVSPAYLSDIGWQLSVMATFGILWFKPAGNFLTTIAAQVATLPLILHHFGNLSVVAPVANVLLLGLIAPIMQLGAVGLIIGPATLLAWPLLRLMTWTVTVLSSLPGASWEVSQVGWTWVVGYYVSVWVCWQVWRRQRQLSG